jgi:dCMP deaminase
MDVAQLVATRGTCNRLYVGAVIARAGRVLSTGYNGPPAGLPHCSHLVGECRPDGSIASCTDAVHAEANVVAFAARHGVATDGADAYVTHSPCLACAKLLINAGLSQVFYRTAFRDVSGILLLMRAGVRCMKFNGGNDFELWKGDGAQ